MFIVDPNLSLDRAPHLPKRSLLEQLGNRVGKQACGTMADPADEVTTYPGTTEIALAPMGETLDAKRRGLGDGARGTDSGPSNSTRALELNASLFTKVRAVVLPGTWKSRKMYVLGVYALCSLFC